ncbi:MAG: hypothetical protein CVU08_00190 [Bacteroidetes bacterium HGW-Bacteroidetes-3]|jgi:hypothetical protein|nr:MAG: hypothetical protein CVU08_00190 [Bacteroidetes bacterium HGW-Bacteroidetes-3]
MNKSFSISLFLMFSCAVLFAQKSVNSYKYILVPKQFEFQKSADQYQLNSLTKFLFERAGFTVLFTDESFPVDLANNRCLALNASVNNASGMLSTKLTIDLLDCYNAKVFSTKEGRSKEKDYKRAYQESIRNAFEDIDELNYAYDGTSVTNANINEDNKAEVAKLTVKETVPVVEKKEVPEEPKVKENKPMEVAKQIVKKEANEAKNEPVKTYVVPVANSIEGKYFVDKWGECNISAKEGYYSFVGGDEKFEFAVIYKTSIPNLFIIKWTAFKQPRLLELDLQGNLKVEDETGDKIYSRVK